MYLKNFKKLRNAFALTAILSMPLQACSSVEAVGDVGGAVAGVAVGTGAQLAGTGIRAVGDVAGGIIGWIPIIGKPLGTAVSWTGGLAASTVEIAGSGAGAAIAAVGSQAIYLTQAGAYFKLAEDVADAGRLASLTADTVSAATYSEVTKVANPASCFMDKASGNIYCNGG